MNAWERLGALGFAAQVLEQARAFGIEIRELKQGERYLKVSPVLSQLAVDVDKWPAPPAGLFVVAERTVYLRSRSGMTLAHEFGHALDCMFGDGIYASGADPNLRAAWQGAREFVTPYAATGADEWFAEGVRAFVGVNDESSFWPKVSRERLRACSPVLDAYLARALGGAQ